MAIDERVGKAHVDIEGKLTPLKRSLMKAKSLVQRGMKTLGRIVKRAAIVIAAVFSYTMYKMIREASAAEEIHAKFRTVFRDLSDEANKWAYDFGKSVGRATDAVKEWMSGLQDLFVPLGMSRKEAYELDKKLVKLAVDVASFNNRVDADVLRDFTSALVGVTMPVRKYGILISEVAMKQAALDKGIKKNYSQLTNLEKVQLRYDIILKSTTDAQGDAIRTGDSFANQVKRLRANITDFLGTAGKQFLANITDIVTATNEWFTANGELMAQGFGNWVKGIAKDLKYIAQQAELAGGFFSTLFGTIKKAVEWTPGYKITKWLRGKGEAALGLTALEESRKEAERLDKILKERGIKVKAGMGAAKGAGGAGTAAAKTLKATAGPSAGFAGLADMWKALSQGKLSAGDKKLINLGQKQLKEQQQTNEQLTDMARSQKRSWRL